MVGYARLILLSIFCTIMKIESAAQWVYTASGSSYHLSCIASNGAYIFAGSDNGGGVYSSNANDIEWTASNLGLTNTFVHSLTTFGSKVFAGTDGGVFVSMDNGTSWAAVNSGMANIKVVCLAASGATIMAGTRGQGIYLSTDNGESWTNSSSGITDKVINALAIHGTTILAGTDTGGVFRTIDNGATWTRASSGLPGLYSSGVTFYSTVYSLAATANYVFAGTFGALCRSSNNGTSWTYDDIKGVPYSNPTIRAVATKDTCIYVGVEGVGMYLSTDDGASWADFNPGSSSKPGSSTDGFAVSKSYVFALVGAHISGGSGYIWRRHLPRAIVASETWKFVTDDDSASNGTLVFERFQDGSKLVHGTWYQPYMDSSIAGVFTSIRTIATDTSFSLFCSGSAAYSYLRSSFTESMSGKLSGDSSSGTYALEFDDYRWPAAMQGKFSATRTSGGGVLSVKDVVSTETPKRFVLFQNYPNPFNPSTSIGYSLPQRSRVTLAVYNTLGQQVGVLVNGDIEAGFHEVQLNATNLASGVYFYRLQAGGHVDVKKCLLMK